MKTLLNNEIGNNIHGILYICKYDSEENELTVVNEIQFENPFDALNAFANIRNPESQLAMGDTHEKFMEELGQLHDIMTDPKKYAYLADVL